VDNGLLSFYPPPGRQLFPVDEMTFLVNETDIDLTKGGPMKPCPNQLACMRNVTRIQMRTSKKNLQLALEQLFLTYQGKPDYSGPDVLRLAQARSVASAFCAH
jgi:hypothetical protein